MGTKTTFVCDCCFRESDNNLGWVRISVNGASGGKQLMPEDNRDLCVICWSPLQTLMKEVQWGRKRSGIRPTLSRAEKITRAICSRAAQSVGPNALETRSPAARHILREIARMDVGTKEQIQEQLETSRQLLQQSLDENHQRAAPDPHTGAGGNAFDDDGQPYIRSGLTEAAFTSTTPFRNLQTFAPDFAAFKQRSAMNPFGRIILGALALFILWKLVQSFSSGGDL